MDSTMQRYSLLLYVIVGLCASMVLSFSCSKEGTINYDRLVGEWLVVSPETERGLPFHINDTIWFNDVPAMYPKGYYEMTNGHAENNGKPYSTQYQCIVDSDKYEMRLSRTGDITRHYDILFLKRKTIVLRRKGREELIELKRLSDNQFPHFA